MMAEHFARQTKHKSNNFPIKKRRKAMKKVVYTLFFVVSVALAGYGIAGFQADAPSTQLVGKCGLDKNGEFDKPNELDKADILDKCNELEKADALGVGVL